MSTETVTVNLRFFGGGLCGVPIAPLFPAETLMTSTAAVESVSPATAATLIASAASFKCTSDGLCTRLQPCQTYGYCAEKLFFCKIKYQYADVKLTFFITGISTLNHLHLRRLL